MQRFDQPSVPRAFEGHGIVLDKADSSPKRKRGSRRPAPDLKLEPGMFGSACVSGLVEDWIVPIVVERIVQDILRSPPNTEE